MTGYLQQTAGAVARFLPSFPFSFPSSPAPFPNANAFESCCNNNIKGNFASNKGIRAGKGQSQDPTQLISNPPTGNSVNTLGMVPVAPDTEIFYYSIPKSQ